MNRTRILLIVITIVGALVASGAIVGGVLSRGGDGGSPAAPDATEEVASSAYAGSVDTARIAAEGRPAGLESGADAVPGAPPAAEQPASEPPAVDPKLQGLLDRKIIQSASVDIEVKEVGRSFQEIIRVAETAGGFVASSSFSNVDDQQIADLTIRVPGDQYQHVLAGIRAMGDVTQEGSEANDVTEEYTDLQGRLRTLQATEQRYLELLAQATAINDILLVQDRLDGVRGQIEQVQGRINLLEHLTDLATVTIHLRPLAAGVQPPDGGGVHPLEAAENAWEHSLDALRGLAAAALVVGVFSWWLLPPLAALGLGARWWLGRRPRPPSGQPA